MHKFRANEKLVITDVNHPEYGNIFFFAYKEFFAYKDKQEQEKCMVLTRQPYSPSKANVFIRVYPAQITVLENKETD